MTGSIAAEFRAMTSLTSFAPARDWACAVACATEARAASRPSSVKRSTLASESCAKYVNWLMAASLAAVIWSILNMAGFPLKVVLGRRYAALHKRHFIPYSPQVKQYLLHCTMKKAAPRDGLSFKRLGATGR